jgi:hypothetical protein
MTKSVFLSYSGDDRVALLAAALRWHGMRPWRDGDSLALGVPTRAEIVAALADCRAAMVWLTETTLNSDYVTRVELPAIFEEHDQRGLDIIPIFVDWRPDDASVVVRGVVGREIGDHNGAVIDTAALIENEVMRIAGGYAQSALISASKSTSSWRPTVRCATRSNAAEGADIADLDLDWTREYPSDGRLPNLETRERLRQALSRVSDELIGVAGPGVLDLYIRCHLHLGLALGHAFRRTTGLRPRVFADGQWWSCEVIDSLPGQGLTESVIHGPATATVASVELSITQDVRPGVNQTVSHSGVPYYTRSQMQPAVGTGQSALTDPGTSNIWADQAAEAIRTAGRPPGITAVDLFLAAPLQFAVALGWRLNAVGPVRIFHWVGNAGPYTEAWTLPAT